MSNAIVRSCEVSESVYIQAYITYIQYIHANWHHHPTGNEFFSTIFLPYIISICNYLAAGSIPMGFFLDYKLKSIVEVLRST